MHRELGGDISREADSDWPKSILYHKASCSENRTGVRKEAWEGVFGDIHPTDRQHRQGLRYKMQESKRMLKQI